MYRNTLNKRVEKAHEMETDKQIKNEVIIISHSEKVWEDTNCKNKKRIFFKPNIY